MLAEELQFAKQYLDENGTLPMFYLIGCLLQHSYVRNAIIFSKALGIDGSHPVPVSQLAEEYGIKPNNVRTQITGRTFMRDRSFNSLRDEGLWAPYRHFQRDCLSENDGVYEWIKREERLPYNFRAFCVISTIFREYKLIDVSTEGKVLSTLNIEKCYEEHQPFLTYAINKEMQDFHFGGTLPEMRRLFIDKKIPRDAVSIQNYFINYNRYWYHNRRNDYDYCERVQHIIERMRDDIYGHLWK